MVEVTPPPAVATEAETEKQKTHPRGVVEAGNGFDNLSLDVPPVEPPVASPGLVTKTTSTEPTPLVDSETSTPVAPKEERSGRRKNREVAAATTIAPVVPEVPVTDLLAEPPLADTATAAAPQPPASVADCSALQMPTPPPPSWRNHLTLGVSAFAGMALALGAWLFWSMSQSDDSTETAAYRVPARIATEQVLADLPHVAGTPHEQQPSDGTAAKIAATAEPKKTTRPPLPELPESNPTEPPLPETVVGGPDDRAPATEPDDNPARSRLPEEPATTDPLAESPLGFDFDGPLLPFERPKPKPQPEQVTEEQPRPEPKAPEPSVEITQLLQVAVPAVRVRSLPLDRFADFVSQLLARPVLLDPLALEAVGITRKTPMTLQSKGATIDELLRLTLARHGLSYRALGNALLITTPAPGSETTKQVRYRIGDLAETSTGMGQFADLTRQVIAPESWNANGGTGTVSVDGDALLIDQIASARYQLLVLCEKLRVARGMKPKSRFDASRFRLASRHAMAKSGLKKFVSFDGADVPLSVVLRQLAYQSGVELNIDHLAFISSDLPDSLPATLSVRGKSLETALQELLEPLDLKYYALGRDRIVITTPHALQRTMLWEVFPVPAHLTSVPEVDAWMDQLRRQVDQPTWDAAGGPGTIAFDRDSKHVVIRQNPAVLANLTEQLGS